MQKQKVAIIGSGNIGTDLLIKIIRKSEVLEMAVLVGIDPKSDGLARAKRMGIQTSHEGIDGLVKMDIFKEIKYVFDATSAKAHAYNYNVLKNYPAIKVIDLTPAAIGPYIIPPVNLSTSLAEQNVNMVTCGGQATIPIVAAVSKVTKVHYGEIVASIASKSAGPGTRANIDEFTETTSEAIEKVGGATKGKAIIILNPAEPPLIMRDTVFTLSEQGDREAIRKSIHEMAEAVQKYVPGYSLHQEVQFEDIPEDQPMYIEGIGHCHGLKTMVLLQVRGAGHYLPEHRLNLNFTATNVGDSDFGFNVKYKTWSEYNWQSPFGLGPVESANVVDVALTYKLKALQSQIKFGASNLFGNGYNTGNKAFTILHKMYNQRTKEMVSNMTVSLVLFDKIKRKAIAFPTPLKASLLQ